MSTVPKGLTLKEKRDWIIKRLAVLQEKKAKSIFKSKANEEIIELKKELGFTIVQLRKTNPIVKGGGKEATNFYELFYEAAEQFLGPQEFERICQLAQHYKADQDG